MVNLFHLNLKKCPNSPLNPIPYFRPFNKSFMFGGDDGGGTVKKSLPSRGVKRSRRRRDGEAAELAQLSAELRSSLVEVVMVVQGVYVWQFGALGRWRNRTRVKAASTWDICRV